MSEKINIFKIGTRVILEIVEKKYLGTISNCDVGTSVNIVIKKPDMTLLHIMADTECLIQMVGNDGKIYVFKTTLIRRKIPLIVVKYPEKMETFSHTELKKIATSIWCAILVEKSRDLNQDNVKKPTLIGVGDGTVVELNKLGCRLMTDYRAKTGSVICLSLQYSDSDEKILKCYGKIKSITAAPYDLIYCDINFIDMNEEGKKVIGEILDNPVA